MDNKEFAQGAVNDAFMARLDAEADAFHKFFSNEGPRVMLTAFAAAGIEEMSRIIDFVQKNGLEEAMHQYEKAMLIGAFHAGTTAVIMEGEK